MSLLQVGRQVGELPLSRKPVIRARHSPMDKSTIVSIFPKEIIEVKHTIYPGKFVIPPGKFDHPSVTVILPSSWWNAQISDAKPDVEVAVPSNEVAHSIIHDYCLSMIEANSEMMPGLFFVDGVKTVDEIKKSFSGELLKAKAKQDAWFKQLIYVADHLWAVSNGSPRTISDEMKMAANELGQIDKPWLKSQQMNDMVKCKNCGSLKNVEFPSCAVCSYTDLTHPTARVLFPEKFVGGPNTEKK